ncbi:MAG: signal peptidase I [Verrucomicrobia bacterium]|nr:MAG: signal peptidase I [Verrucomicrobiota bacterium]
MCYTAYAILIIAAWWKIFSKAGQPGWAAIIPIYNWIVWCKIVGRPAWWVLLLLICFPIFFIILSIDLAKSFGKGVGFAIGLILLSVIFFPILGFGSATYQGPSAAPKP